MPSQKSTVDLIAHNQSALFTNKPNLSKNISQDKLLNLSPIQFICHHYDFVAKVGTMLNQKYGPGTDIKKIPIDKLTTDNYQDIVNLLAENELLPQEKWTSFYVQIILEDLFGMGVLASLMNDSSVDEIMVVSHDKIFVERFGKIQKTPIQFPTVDDAKNIVRRFISPLNKRLDASSPNVNAQLPDGSRLSASIAPLRANDEISITIRKFKSTVEPLSFYVEKYKSETEEMANFLEKAVASKLSMIVSGGTGSGKTTLLNSLSFAIPNSERILTVEDTLELRLQQDNVETYQTVEPNMEGKGGFSMQQTIIEALRKRPDRIIVGECRGPEIVEMLNAMNTGHEGSLSTIHANSPADLVTRASTMIRSNPNSAHLQERSILEMLDSIDIIVQQSRLEDGSRRIMNITEVVGAGSKGLKRLQSKGKIKKDAHVEEKLYLQDIFRFVITDTDEKGKVHGHFETTGYVPFCAQKMRQFGYNFDDSFFQKRVLLEV